MTKYVALLRGINLGKRQIKMAELKILFEELGFTDVRTLLASGNVVFAAKDAKPEALGSKIEAAIKEKFGFDVPVILRSEKEIGALVASNPFKGVKVTPQTRLYITFLSEPPKAKLKAPYKDGDFTLRAITNHLVSVLGPQTVSPDVMDFLGKQFGKDITTRNWNTVMKIAKAMGKTSE